MHSGVGRGGDEDAGSRFTKILLPERDPALNWTIDVASVLGEYLNELQGAAGSLQDGANLNFVEAALVVQGSAGIYSRKTDYLHSLVLHTLTALTTGDTNGSNDGDESGDAQGDGGDGDDCDMRRFLSLDDVEVVGSGSEPSRLDMREKGQKKTTEDEDDDDDEGGLAGGAARQGSKLPPRAPPILLTVEEELDGGKGSSTVPFSELSAFKMAAFVSHVSGSVFLEAQDGDVMDALLRLPRRRAAHVRTAPGAGSPAFAFPQPGLSPDCTPPFPRNGWSSSPYADRGKAVAEDLGGAGCSHWGEGAARQSEWQAAEGMGGMGSGDDEDEDGMGTAGGFDCGDWGEAAAGSGDAHGSHAGEWSGGAGGSGSGAGSGGGVGVPGSAQNKSGSKGGSGKGSGKGSASGRGGGQGEAAGEYDPFAPLDPNEAGCMPQRPLRKGRPYLRVKRKTDGGDLASSLSDPGVWLSFPLLAGRGRGMIFPDIESIMQRAVMRDRKRQQDGVPRGSFDGGGSQKVGRDGREEGGGWGAWQAGSALEPPTGNVFADLDANLEDGERAHGSHGSAHRGGAGGAHGDAHAGAEGLGAQGFGFDGMDIEDDDDGAAGMDDGGSDGEDGEDGEGERTGVERPRSTGPSGADSLPGMDWEANVLHSDTPLPADPSAPHVATVEAMRDAHVAEMIQRAAEMQARRSEVETRVGDWQSRILPLLEQQDERPPFDIHVYGDRILSALEQKHMQQEQQRQQEMAEMEGAGQGEEGRQQQQLCEDLFENVINTPHAYEVPRYFSALLQLVNNGNVSLSVDPHGLLQPTSLPLPSSSRSSSIAAPVEASSSLTSTAPSSSAPRCYYRGSSFSVRLHSLNRRQEELRGYVAPSQRREGGSGTGESGGKGKGKGNGQQRRENQGERHQWGGDAFANAAGRADGCENSGGGSGSGLGSDSNKSGSEKGDTDHRKRKARTRELPPRPPASQPPPAVPSSSLREKGRLEEEEHEWEDGENQGSEGGGGHRIVKNRRVLTESSKGVNGKEVLEKRNEDKRRKLLEESTEEGEVEEAREEVIGDEEEGNEDCDRTEGAGLDETRRCREQEEMLLHGNGKRQKKDGMQATGGGASGSSLGAHSNVGGFQRCAEACFATMLTRTVINPCELALSSLPCRSARAFSPPAAAALVARPCGESATKPWRPSFNDSPKRYGGQVAIKTRLRVVPRASATREQPLQNQQSPQTPEPGEIQFTAERTVLIPCPQVRVPAAAPGAAAGSAERPAVRAAGSVAGDRQIVSVGEYLAEQTERIVRVVFPDSKRLMRLDADLWRVVIRQLTFFSITATPICLLRVYHDGSSLRLFSNQLQLDFIVNLAFTVRLPMPLSLIPKPAVEAVGNALLDGVLGAMQASLLNGLVRDYTLWATEEAKERAGGVGREWVDGVPATMGQPGGFERKGA
ncbi:unnamed protein product [Closterium sp. Naga37s-1]|nr:unnamed protein product [Closterium sp. Naga37s-1]